jgi:hypothetical protein
METITFSPDLALREAGIIIELLPKDPYRKLAELLMDFKAIVRAEAARAICHKFNLRVDRLTEELRIEEFDAENERKMLERKSFTLKQYVDLIDKKKARMNAAGNKWNDYNGQEYKDPNTVLQVCMYDMLRHIVWKLTDSDHDISQIALVENAWDRAIEEIEKR